MPLRITPSVAEQEGQQTETEATGAPQKHHYTLNQQVGSITHQSDGTNSHKYIETIIKLLISLSRTEFITPTIYIDEPEIGLHPKLGEQFITTIHTTYNRYKKSVPEKESGKYSTPYPCLIFSTHAPNILKQTIKLFSTDQQILHFSKKNKHSTKISKLNSQYSDLRFINMFSDNEARLFFQ